MNISEKDIEEFQEIYKKEYGEDISRKKAYETAHNLLDLFKIFYRNEIKEQERQLKLKKYSKGFYVEGVGYTCPICGNSISNEETWYDKWGIKCLICQRNIDKKIIPGSVIKNKDSWYSVYDLESRFNVNKRAMKRLIKEDILKPRIVLNNFGEAHAYLFLIKDNKDILPPKKLTEPQVVSETINNGGERIHLEPWYKFVDPSEHLKGYKIIEYLSLK